MPEQNHRAGGLLTAMLIPQQIIALVLYPGEACIYAAEDRSIESVAESDPVIKAISR
jgi:hypothetical protein